MKPKLYDKGLEQHLTSKILLGNLVMIFWIALGTIAVWLLYPILSVFFLAFAVIMVYIVLRKVVCTNCYYYDKWCSIGWGKLAAKLFKKGNIEKFNTNIGVKLAPLVYGLLTIIPLIAIVVSIILLFDYTKISILILLLLVSVYSGGISRKYACSKCKMKISCPGSASK